MKVAIATSNAFLNDRGMVKVLVDKYTSKPLVREDRLSGFYLTGYDSLGCFVWAPCDQFGNPVAEFACDQFGNPVAEFVVL